MVSLLFVSLEQPTFGAAQNFTEEEFFSKCFFTPRRTPVASWQSCSVLAILAQLEPWMSESIGLGCEASGSRLDRRQVLLLPLPGLEKEEENKEVWRTGEQPLLHCFRGQEVLGQS